MAEWAGGFLSVSGVVAGRGDRGGGDFGGRVGHGDSESAARPASGRGVGLVSRDIGAGDWIGAGRGPVHGGPDTYLPLIGLKHHAVLERAVPRDGTVAPEERLRTLRRR